MRYQGPRFRGDDGWGVFCDGFSFRGVRDPSTSGLWPFAQDDNWAGLVGMTIWDRFVDILVGVNYYAGVGFGFVPLY